MILTGTTMKDQNTQNTHDSLHGTAALKYKWHLTLHPSVKLVNDSSRNALPKLFGTYFHPTRAKLQWVHSPDDKESILAWTSRDHRKNRHRAMTPKSGHSRHGKNVWQRVGHMTRVEYWNISWWVAMVCLFHLYYMSYVETN